MLPTQLTKRTEFFVLAVGLLCLTLFALLPLIFPDSQDITSEYLGKLRHGSGSFYGVSYTDLATDMVGMRALVQREDPYPLLGPAMEELGLNWQLDFHSPRLPGGFLLAAPVAFFPWATASALWAVLMILSWMLALRLLGLSWDVAFGLGGLLVWWPPAALALGQSTAPWLFFLALAYARRAGTPAQSGAAIALASLGKGTPAITLINFVKSHTRWRVIAGFAAVWLGALALILLLNAEALPRYWQVNQTNSPDIFERADNAAPFAVFWRLAGWLGVLTWLLFIVALAVRVYRASPKMDTEGWVLSFYLAVGVLPVLWVFSLLPLLPVYWHSLTARGRWSRALAAGALVLTYIGPAFGPESVPFIGGSVVLLGISLFV